MTIIIEYDEHGHFYHLMIKIFLSSYIIQTFTFLKKFYEKKHFIHHPERHFINCRLNARL